MELVLASHGFAGLGGSETYLLTVAEHLERLGHEVTIYAVELGEMADIARQRGIRVTSNETELPEGCDAILAQDGIVSLGLAETYPKVPQVFVAHAYAIDLQLPPQLPDVVSPVVVMNDRVERRMRSLSTVPEVVRLHQPVDIERFAPRGVIRKRPRRLLVLGNYLRGERYELLLEACEAEGVECDRLGVYGTASAAPEVAIADADIVVGYGRSILEGMACGRAAYVLDHEGGDGWVTPDRYPAMEADGFSGAASPEPLSPSALSRDLQDYRPQMGVVNRDLVLLRHNAHRHVQELVGLLRRATGSSAPARTPLREMARLARVGWQAEGRAIQLGAENALVRERAERLQTERDALEPQVHEATVRADRAEQRAAELERTMQAFKQTRRYRLAVSLAEPLDRLRGLKPF